MKWFFFLLLLINIGLFVWIYPQQPPPQPEPIRLPGVKRLVLLSEVNQATAESGRASELDDLPESTLEVRVDQPLTSAQDLQPAVEGPSPASVSSSGSEALSESSADLHTQSEGGKLMPKRTEPDRATEFGSRVKPEQSGNDVRSGPPRQCRTIGPLGKRAQLDKLSISLMAMGIQTEMQIESTDEQEGYWVMIPPQQNREAAVAVVKRLREAGVSDLWRFTSGSLAHAISLGLFRNESRAEIRRKAIAAKGFDAEVRPRYRQKNTYWLDFSFTGDSPLSEADWNSITEIYPGLEQHSRDCAVMGGR
jgi:hypothetical protein